MEETTTTTNGHAIKQWPERTCGRCRKKFQPSTARERRCAECTAEATEHPSRSRKKARPPSKLAARRRVSAAAPTLTSSSNGTTLAQPESTPARPLHPDQIATAAELLALAGYTVESVRTPAGLFLRVT